ncbi:hypothetical protein RFI_19596, partial [Reticulomyxa filosa]
MMIAEIYLIHKKDQQKYVQHFEELVREQQSASLEPNESDQVRYLVLLADAYMRVRRIDDAIITYQQALANIDSDGGQIVTKLGGALIASHQFEKAIEHYEVIICLLSLILLLSLLLFIVLLIAIYINLLLLLLLLLKDALQSNHLSPQERRSVQLELAELYIDFNRHSQAQQLLVESINPTAESFEEIQNNVQLLELFAELYTNVNQINDALILYEKICEQYDKLLTIRNGTYFTHELEKKAADAYFFLYFAIKKLFTAGNEEENEQAQYNATAQKCLSQCLELNLRHSKALLASFTKKKRQYDACKANLIELIEVEPTQDDVIAQDIKNAVILLAECHIRCNDHKKCIPWLEKSCIAHSSNPPIEYEIVWMYAQVLWMSNDVKGLKCLMEIYDSKRGSSEKAQSTMYDCFAHYFRGMVAYVMENDAKAAIDYFNQSKMCSRHMMGLLKCDEKSLYADDVFDYYTETIKQMITIYLRPDCYQTFYDVLQEYIHEKRSIHLETAYLLLQEWKTYTYENAKDPLVIVYGCRILLCTQKRQDIEKACQTLEAMCKRYPTHFHCHYTYAVALALIEQVDEAIT